MQRAHLTDAGLMMDVSRAGAAWLAEPCQTRAAELLAARDFAIRRLVINGHSPAAAIDMLRAALKQAADDHRNAGRAMPSAEQCAALAPIARAA